MLWKCYTQYVRKFGKFSSGHWKRSVFIPIPKKGNAKECSNYCTIAVISHASKVMLKIFQARLQQYLNHKLPDVCEKKAFRMGENNSKWRNRQSINLKNVQATPVAQFYFTSFILFLTRLWRRQKNFKIFRKEILIYYHYDQYDITY